MMSAVFVDISPTHPRIFFADTVTPNGCQVNFPPAAVILGHVFA
jgi:hypothetical protein